MGKKEGFGVMAMKLRILIISLLILSIFATLVIADTDVLDVRITEYVSEVVAYDQVYGPLGGSPDILTEANMELGENRTGLSRTDVVLHDIIVYGWVNITNVETIGNMTLSSINVTFNNTYNITGIDVYSAPNYLSPYASMINISVKRVNPGNPNNISIFIPELRAGDTVLINYTVIGTGVGEPLNFTENILHGEYDRKGGKCIC